MEHGAVKEMEEIQEYRKMGVPEVDGQQRELRAVIKQVWMLCRGQWDALKNLKQKYEMITLVLNLSLNLFIFKLSPPSPFFYFSPSLSHKLEERGVRLEVE